MPEVVIELWLDCFSQTTLKGLEKRLFYTPFGCRATNNLVAMLWKHNVV